MKTQSFYRQEFTPGGSSQIYEDNNTFLGFVAILIENMPIEFSSTPVIKFR
jgi:hypothetical protein